MTGSNLTYIDDNNCFFLWVGKKYTMDINSVKLTYDNSFMQTILTKRKFDFYWVHYFTKLCYKRYGCKKYGIDSGIVSFLIELNSPKRFLSLAVTELFYPIAGSVFFVNRTICSVTGILFLDDRTIFSACENSFLN
jgi:hypothetical protein